MTHIYGPTTEASDLIHAEKHRGKGESYREYVSRLSATLKDSEEHFNAIRDILLDMRFLPAGRIQTAVGSSKAVTAYNCYVSGTLEDTFCEGEGSIMGRAHQAAATMRMGGGIGYDFSPLRPRGAIIRKLLSQSSGPLPFMEIFDATCRATNSAGARRGAQMGVLRVDHPDIEEFIRSKQNHDKLRGFNISVAVTDTFIRAVIADTDFDLVFDKQVWRTVRARDLWELLMRSTYDWADPGVLFIDRINEQNNLYYCETIAATNPCGEQPLPPFGACLLGSINLVRYLERRSPSHPWTFNYEQLCLDVPWIVRTLDNVIDIAKYPLYAQEKEAQSKRRMGIGVTGAANCIEALGQPYGSRGFIAALRSILTIIRNFAYEASSNLAAEKGAFPLFDADKYLEGAFVSELPSYIQDLIRTQGIRNSHLLSIAPTGSISLVADNVSSGIEPVFSYYQRRAVNRPDGQVIMELEDYGHKFLGVKGKTADQCTVDDHLNVMAACADLVDSAVSKTCNVPKDIAWEDFKNIYIRAWYAGCKGCTTYRMGGMREAILEAKGADDEQPTEIESTSGHGRLGDEDRTREDRAEREREREAPVMAELSCEFDPATGRRSCD